jgi:signal transduction histidine kinase
MGKLTADALMTNVAHGSGSFLAILNSDRQIVFANRTLIDTFGVADEDAIGRRPGELMSCRSAEVGPDGCGTSPFCKTCGAAQALSRAKLGSPQEKECRILRVNGDPLELKIAATPFALDNETFILFSAVDISDAKRRRSLERIFFHDIMNTATGVRGLSSMAREVTDEERTEILELLESTSEHLIDEIQGQTELLAAETNDLVVHPRTIQSRTLLDSLGSQYATHEVGMGRVIELGESNCDVDFVSDPVLLCRVIGNLTKNALEATPEGGVVTLWCRRDGQRLSFSVHNDGVMPEQSQLQVFQRSFSTKGDGRGLGTYGSRLLTERYLQAEVSFVSTAAEGTTFTVSLPLTLPESSSGRETLPMPVVYKAS